MPGKKPKTLAEMANVGPATLGDFKVLGIQDPKQLAKCEAFELWEDLCKRTRKRHDLCCIDVFMSAIAQARGEAPCPWWHFTKDRKTLAWSAGGHRHLRRRLHGKRKCDKCCEVHKYTILR